jgi:hypothetical protein
LATALGEQEFFVTAPARSRNSSSSKSDFLRFGVRILDVK